MKKWHSRQEYRDTRDRVQEEAPRNGYRSKSLKTWYGELILQKPQLREIPFETKVFERYTRTEKALVNAIIESYLQEYLREGLRL